MTIDKTILINNMDPSAPIRKLSASQLKVIHNVALRYRPDLHINGAAQAGAFGQTIRSLQKLKLVEMGDTWDRFGRSIWSGRLTMRGVRVHRLQCCHRGTNEDDIRVRDIEEAMLGKEKDDRKIPF
jgi:hypothetical protein